MGVAQDDAEAASCFRRALEAEAYDYHASEVSAAEDAYFAFKASRLGGDEREDVTAKNVIASRAIEVARSAVGRDWKYGVNNVGEYLSKCLDKTLQLRLVGRTLGPLGDTKPLGCVLAANETMMSRSTSTTLMRCYH